MKPTKASAAHHSPDETHNDDVAHEHSDINIGALVWSMVIMFSVVIGTAGLMAVLFSFLASQARARDPKLSPLAMPVTTMPPTTTASPFFGGAPDPKLMTAEPVHLKEFRAEEQQALHGYGWMNQKAGIVHIPIEDAKALILKSGLPVRPDPLTDSGLGMRRPASGESSSGRNIAHPLPTAAPETAPAPAAAPSHDAHKGGN